MNVYEKIKAKYGHTNRYDQSAKLIANIAFLKIKNEISNGSILFKHGEDSPIDVSNCLPQNQRSDLKLVIEYNFVEDDDKVFHVDGGIDNNVLTLNFTYTKDIGGLAIQAVYYQLLSTVRHELQHYDDIFNKRVTEQSLQQSYVHPPQDLNVTEKNSNLEEWYKYYTQKVESDAFIQGAILLMKKKKVSLRNVFESMFIYLQDEGEVPEHLSKNKLRERVIDHWMKLVEKKFPKTRINYDK